MIPFQNILFYYQKKKHPLTVTMTRTTTNKNNKSCKQNTFDLPKNTY